MSGRERIVEAARGACWGAVTGLVAGSLVGVLMQFQGMFGNHGSAAWSWVVFLASAMAVGAVIGVVTDHRPHETYAVLFRRRSFDLASGVGWGVSYGFLWWVLGDLTLLPVLTGATPHWSAAGIAEGFPSLVGHLGYGAALGAAYYLLESRTNPWWFRRSAAEAERVTAQRDQTLGSAPALWALIVMLALTVPVLVSG